jgi:hypothetical protein
VRQDDRAPFDRALHRARVSAYAPGEFVGQESFMTAGEMRALAVQVGIGPGVGVLDLCCGIAGPDADTVWLTPLDEMTASLERARLVVTRQEDHSGAHRATAQALAGAFAADAEAIAAQIGRRALDELLAAHRLWIEWLDAGRVRKLAVVAERA